MAAQVLSTINLNANVTTLRQSSEVDLIRQMSNLLVSNESDLDQIFRSTCQRVAVGYALFQNVLRRSGMRNFKPAIRTVASFQNLPEDRRKRIETDMKYIRCIYENWDLIVRNCSLEIMTSLDIRPFPLWKLAKCIRLSFVENENNKVNRVRRRPTQRAYDLTMIDEIVENVEGSTQRLLDLVGNDEEQIQKIADDFHQTLLRRAGGGL